ncbi:DUF1631 family protein [Ramlibacter sp.]|uniref:DUF1631 family protein n=1 Tax=Ramlibacter sp. TaxID=1917967 RepID=UPI0025EF269A|nr:DUF1631 family protein [Ramlibacter sp.]
MKLRLGVSDDPTALQPTLNDCLEAVIKQAEPLMSDVLAGLLRATAPTGTQRAPMLSKASVKQAAENLSRDGIRVCKTFQEELSRVVYEGGGKEQVQAELLRFEDLKLFEDAQLDQSIEVARAQQEVATAVDDALPALDGLISTMLGWRTVQPGLNPLRPDVFVRALQACLSIHVPQAEVRELLIAPAGGLLGVSLRKLYRQISDWLQSTGVEPAVPLGGRVSKGSGAGGAAVNDSMAKTLLTLDKLRKLLAGDFDAPRGPQRDFLHTVPASMAMLQDMKGVDTLMKRLEQRPRTHAPAPTVQEAEQAAHEAPPQRLGQQLGEEVVRLLFDNLAADARLLPGLKDNLRTMEPAVLKLAQSDSRFFSDRNHAARQLLDRVTQRSLAFSSQNDPGWQRFATTLEGASRWLDSKVIDAEVFGELLDHLEDQWKDTDKGATDRRTEAARALVHAEQRNLLAQKLAAEFAQVLEGLDVADFVRDFLRNSWPQVVAEAQLSAVDGAADPYGYRALVDDLVWSVQKSTAQRGRRRRLVQMIPGLLAKLREGLQRIDYPPELTLRFFDNLITIHRAAVQERDAGAARAAEAVEAEVSMLDVSEAEAAMWMAQHEMEEAGYLEEDSFLPPDAGEVQDLDALLLGGQAQAAPPHPVAPQPAVPQTTAAVPDAAAPAPAVAPAPVVAPTAPAVAPTAHPPAEHVVGADLRIGSWVELVVDNQWTRMQLTWASPHGTLFMFTSPVGTAHSMSRRTMERLRADGMIRVVAERNVVDEALDNVAKAALQNSLQKRD